MPFNKLFCFYFRSDAGKETTVKDDYLESLDCVTHRLDQTGPTLRAVVSPGRTLRFSPVASGLEKPLLAG